MESCCEGGGFIIIEAIYHPESMGGGTSTVAPEVTTEHHTENSAHHKKQRGGGFCCCFTPYDSRRYSIEDPERSSLREEAKQWSNNFERLLRHPIGCKVFQEFLQGQFSDENLRFWLEAEKYRNMTLEERRANAQTLYEEYVSTVSPCEVSLNAKHRIQIESNITEAHKDLFKQAQDYIFSLMYRDCFPRFLKSRIYKKLCR